MRGLHDLAGRVAVVTGGASGIGKAIAARLQGHGMTVAIADIEEGALAAAAAEIGATAFQVDVSSAESMQALADQVVAQFGKVDLFCSNAGVASTARIEEMTLADWQWLMGVNFYGLVNGISAFLPLLKANPHGAHFALTSSISAFHVTPGIGAYTVSKFAVNALAETLALELEAEGANVGVTILCPGPVSTRLGNSQRNRHSGSGAMLDNDLEQTEEGRALNWMESGHVAGLLLRAIGKGDLYAFTHPEWRDIVSERHARVAEAFAAIPES